MTSTETRTAVVTGAGRGLGAAIATELHHNGHRVAVLDIDGERAATVASEMDASGQTALALRIDVSDPAATRTALDELRGVWGDPDILVNNAARTASGSLWDIDVDEWDDVHATNVRSVFLLSQELAPGMRDRGWGRIINVASLAGQQGGLVSGAHYASAKAGVIVLTKIFAKELATAGVTVNAIAPAATRTPVMDAMDPDELRSAEAAIPVGRFGQPGEVAGLVAYLCCDRTGFVTGATFDVNGGLFMR